MSSKSYSFKTSIFHLSINQYLYLHYQIVPKVSYEQEEQLNLNLSTVKSQIRNGRALLIKMSKREFDILDEMYL
jgi:hypothetical protein